MSNIDSDSNNEEDNQEEEVAAKPLATTRSRRANAGNLMGLMIQDEEDEFYANLYGGFDEEDDDGDFDDEEEEAEEEDEEGAEEEEDEDEEEEDEDEDEGVDQKVLASHIRPGSPNKAAYDSCTKICSVCLSEQSEEDDEIIECDSCGVSVHESCYGVSESPDENDNTSVHSNISSESTEPWFCEPCRRSVRNPMCELCPNTGGIFKQTDTGRWIHMVCALYTRGVTFENIDNLSEVSLFELNYGLFGSKTCTICEDGRLARSGICIGCDAGLCKTFFHATCAQKEGLLFESHSDEVDPYLAHCRQHSDKATIKRKKRICTALYARLNRIEPLQHCSERIKKKLAALTQEPDPHLSRWTPDNRPPIPMKASRSLMTSPSLIMRLNRKSELMGLDLESAFMTVHDEMDMARQKWHIPPAFDLEFVAYCRDRTTRMANMKKQNLELVSQNITLKTEEAKLRDKYNSIKETVSKIRFENESLIKEARALQKSVTATTGKQFNLPLQMEQLIARCMNAKGKSFVKASKSTNKTSSTYGCGKCGHVKDQHLLALCDTCHSYFHIYCLDPPLTRVPKKTKFGGWQCSDCFEKGKEEEEEEEQETIQKAEGPRKLRERIRPSRYDYEYIY